MAQRRKKSATRDAVGTILDVALVGATSSVVAGSGATGATGTLLNQVPTIQAAGVLKKQAKKIKWI